MERECLWCRNEVEGRANKKFCHDNCRYKYNNAIKINAVIIKSIDTALRKNRRIIEELKEGTKVDELTLLQKGFNFKYSTHTYTTLKGETYYYCYEYGYKALGNNFYFLVKQK